MDDKLKFDKHISEMCTRASRQINALKRVSKYLDENCYIMIYKTVISSNFIYCLVSWMFCGKTNLNKLEKLQERALQFVFHDTISSYENLLTQGDFLPLSLYQIQCLGNEVYKFQHIYIWAAIVLLLWIQIMECIAIFSEEYERIACIQEKHH